MALESLSLFIFIDALGWEIVKNRPFLEGIVHTRHPLRTVLGYSSAAVPSILSGRTPSSHGHWSFFYYAPNTSPFRRLRPLCLLPRTVTDRGRVRRQLSKLVQRWLGYTGYFQLYHVPFHYIHLFDYCEKRDLFKQGGLNSGRSIFDLLEDGRVPYHVSDWRQPDAAKIGAATRVLRDGRIQFAFVYLSELDGLMHQVGTHHPAVTDKIHWYDSQIRHLYDLSPQSSVLRFFVFSDHGMTDVHTHYDLMGQVHDLRLTFGRDYVASYDSTMARFWFLNGKAEKQIRDLLDPIPVGRILAEAELGDLGIFWPDAKFGQLIFLVNPGVLIVPSFMGRTPLAAMHGYHPDDADSDGTFVTNLELGSTPKQITDIFPLMAEAAQRGIPPEHGTAGG